MARPEFPVCLAKQSERIPALPESCLRVIAVHTNTRCADPNVPRLGFIDRVNVVFTKAPRLGKLGKRLPTWPERSRRVVATDAPISSRFGFVGLDAREPDVALFVFQDTGDVVTAQTIFLGEMSE